MTNYENSLKVYRDLKNVIDSAENKGIAKGERNAALKMAKVLKSKGISVDIIIETSGLSKEEIEKL